MPTNSLKFSFIPKSSFGKEESFIERKRPRSIVEFIATASFILSIIAFSVLYFYNLSITKQITEKQKEITSVESYDQASVAKAVAFRTRVSLAQQLINAHLAMSPIFNFLTQNSLNSIYYDQFSFKKEGDTWTLSLTGEAPSYSSLAYQTDILRENINSNKSKELSSFDVYDVTLTKYGTVSFSLKATFAPNYLSYIKTLPSEPAVAPNSGSSGGTATSTVEVKGNASSTPSKK